MERKIIIKNGMVETSFNLSKVAKALASCLGLPKIRVNMVDYETNEPRQAPATKRIRKSWIVKSIISRIAEQNNKMEIKKSQKLRVREET